MSDHEIIMFFINCKHPSINKKAPDRVYFYHKDDISSLKSGLQEFEEAFSAWDTLQNSVEHNRQLLEDVTHKAISKHIPSKLARSCNKLPWINPLIKQKMKLRNHLYYRAKRTGNCTGWCNYKQEMHSTFY